MDGEKHRGRTTTITKRQKIRKMSKDLNANNNLPDMSRGFEKIVKMDEDMVEWNTFLNKVWSNKAKMPSLYSEKSLTWEA
jgi:hypothetical protein